MPILDSLTSIRGIWISRVSHHLARGEGIRESFQEQLEIYYDQLIQCVASGNPTWLDPVVNEWVQAQTVSELEEKATSLPPIIDQFLQTTCSVARECLAPQTAIELVEAVLPAYQHMTRLAYELETDRHVEHISRELERARLSLEHLDKNKSDFISIAAHELKTPLTLIEGYASMLAEVVGRDPEQVDIMLKGIDNGTRRLTEIIDDMIDVSMIDNDLLSLNFQPVWLNRLLDAIQREVEGIVEERQLILTVRPFQGGEEMLFADGERLYQALRNVILNAIKFTPDGGQIIVDGRRLPGFNEITVADTGIGIDPEYHSLIFEKFGRLGRASLHSSGKTKFKGGGPGLGLPITKGIIEAHGGAIWVESEGYDEKRHPGATFHILLPVRKEPPDEKFAQLFRSPSEANQDREVLIGS